MWYTANSEIRIGVRGYERTKKRTTKATKNRKA
jgi:hypothetical protein